jgi:hypothetical protein
MLCFCRLIYVSYGRIHQRQLTLTGVGEYGPKRFNLTIRDPNSKCCPNFGIFSHEFFSKKLFFFFKLKFYLLCLMFCLSDIFLQRIT